MVEEIRPNLFRVKIPLPDTPLKYLNSYIIISDERNLIIDTGLNRQECFEAMESALKELRVEKAVTDFHHAFSCRSFRPFNKTGYRLFQGIFQSS